MMLFGRRRLLRNKLLKPIRDGRAVAPLRAFGKLELATEYVEVGCEDPEQARAFRIWVDDGWKRLQSRFQNETPQIRQHRLLLSVDSGHVWIVGCLWNSSDRRSEQGSQRNFPFTLFVVVPAPTRSRGLAMASTFCLPMWEQMEGALPTLVQASDRSECRRLIQRRAVVVDTSRAAGRGDPLAAAERIGLGSWLEQLVSEKGLIDELLSNLQRQVAKFVGSRGREALVWRLPLATGVEQAPQLAAWSIWLERNLRRRAREFGLFLPMEPAGWASEMRAVLRGILPEDFVSLSASASHVDHALGLCLTVLAVAATRRGAPVGLSKEELCSSAQTLAAFARRSIL